MVPRVSARQRLAVAVCMAAEVAVVALTAATQDTGGALAVIAALVLAPVAVGLTALVGHRLAGARFAVAAAVVYVVLPLLANRFALATYRGTFDRHALPALVGLQATGTFALGLALAAVVAFAPRAVTAAAGLVALVAAAAIWGFGPVGDLRPALHETVWSIAFVEWLLVAGLLGCALRSPARAAALGGWLLAAVFWAAHRGYDGGIFWSSLAVALPAAAIAVSSLGLLVPRLSPIRSRAAEPTSH